MDNRTQALLDKCECMTLLCTRTATYWSYVKMAFNINQDIKIDSKLISKSVKLLMPPKKQKEISETSSLKHNREKKYNFKSKGEIILTALTLTSDGVNTSYEDMSIALNDLVEINEIELVKSILTENLLHYYKP